MEHESSIDYQCNAIIDILSEMVTTYLKTNINEKQKGSMKTNESKTVNK